MTFELQRDICRSRCRSTTKDWKKVFFILDSQKEQTDEGEELPYQMSDLECGTESDGSNDRILLLWPSIIAHKIDEESPFYEMSPQDMLNAQFELVCMTT